MIEVRDVRKWIQNGARRVDILRGIDLVIPAGQFIAIVGASGSGTAMSAHARAPERRSTTRRAR